MQYLHEAFKISGDFIADAMKEAKESGRTIASVIRENIEDTNANITIIVSPGDGVPETQQRTGRKKGFGVVDSVSRGFGVVS